MKNFFFLLPLLMLLSFSCTKKNKSTEPELPPLTTEGKNVMGCKVNGKVQIYSGKRSFGNDNGVDYNPSSIKVIIFADNIAYEHEIKITINIPYNAIVTDTSYHFTSETSNNYAQYFPNSANFLTDNNSGWVRFARLDADVAAGTFEFTAYHDGDFAVITEGRFDISTH